MNKKERILIGERISELIKINGGTLEVSIGADVSRKLIAKIKRGENVQTDTLNRLIAYLGHELYLRKSI